MAEEKIEVSPHGESQYHPKGVAFNPKTIGLGVFNCITHYIYAQMVILTTGPDTPPLHTASDDRAQPVDEGELGNKFDPCFHGVFLLDIESVGSGFLSCYWYSLYGGGVLYFGTDRRNPLSGGLSQLSPLLVVQSNDC